MTRQVILFLLLPISFCSSQLFEKSRINSIQSNCPRLYPKIFQDYVPQGNMTAGTFTEIDSSNNFKRCIRKCCLANDCNVAFRSNDKCYHITCASNALCVPIRASTELGQHVSMVLIRPVQLDESWSDFFEPENTEDDIMNESDLSYMLNDSELKDVYKNLLEADESVFDYQVSCSVGIENTCETYEECIQNVPKSRAGTCRCKVGYARNVNGACIFEGENIIAEETANSNISAASAIVTKKHLVVTAESKEVKLPANEVSIIAYVSPTPHESEKYQYDWNSLQQPSGSTAVKHQNGEEMHLTKLSEGLYTFKVSVSSDDAYGETFVNVTVLPPSRINQPPKIVITPANQTVKLPNTGAVLDASSSTDDDGIVSWHWELQQGPLGYEPSLKETPTLQLNDLTRPGNYTFKLTVTDTDKVTTSSTANITVLKVTDYPPEANAGEDVIIYLPHNEIMLNGNLSTDDHAIVTWEWTKSAGDADKAVDMQDTRTPYLKLSHLEEGMYTFSLKVTDSANQSSTAEVHVFVKPPTNQPPIAEAGDNITISLPQTWVVVDAGQSKDDNKITGFHWEQVEGPSTVVFKNVNNSKTNVTDLTKGQYIFKIFVTDDNKNVANDVVFVTVEQNSNQKPKANAGGNFEIELPRNVISINGSKSTDDWSIEQWKWIRDDSSLAMGNIAEGSDSLPVLLLINAVAGKYVFNLTVYDKQGLSDIDTVIVTVKNDPKLYYLIEMIIDSDINHVSEAQYRVIKGKLALLVQDDAKLQVREIRPESGTNRAVISFYVDNAKGKPIDANEVVYRLRQKLRMDEGLLGFNVFQLQTTICQNNCSGHGVCDEKSRNCICEAFWMQDLFKIYFGTYEDSDCSWSILYVVLGAICTIFSILGLVWGVSYLCCNLLIKKRINSKPSTYKLIEDSEDLPPYCRKGQLSDSDTDSDVVFESRSKLSGRFHGDSRNGHKPSRNGLAKMNRRMKT
ncbi:hypothetical protein FQA39_LY04383 [Lamprigera yunnana]|nr:hypothetical protein FQA39_LY04383 [Lamprigera yunnana]